MCTLSKSTRYRLAAIAILLLAFGLRSYTLMGRTLWFDEAWEYWVATSALPDLLEAVRTTLRDPPLYSVLLHFWLYLGQDEFWLRFPSLWISMAGLLGVMTLTRLAFSRAAGLVAACLLAFSALDIRYAQEAGQYILVASLLSWNLVFLWQLIQYDRWRWAGLWGGSAVLALYSFYGPGLTIGVTALASVVYASIGRRWRLLRKIVAAGSVSVLLTLPLVFAWVPGQLVQIPGAEPKPLLLGAPGAEIQAFAASTAGLLRYQLMTHQFAGWPWPQIPEWLVWLPLVIFLTMSARHYKVHLVLIWFVATLLVYYVVSRTGAYPYGERYSLILSPLLWSCVAAGFVALWTRQKAVAGLLLAAIVVVSLLAPPEPQQDLRTITRIWLAERRDDTPTYVYYGAAPGLRYQMTRLEAAPAVAGVWYMPCWQGKPAAACAQGNIFYGRWIRNFPPERKRESILATLTRRDEAGTTAGGTGQEPRRFWIIFSHVRPGEDDEILAALGDAYAVTVRHQAENAEAVLLEQR